MGFKILKNFLALTLMCQVVFAKENNMKQIRTYLSYTYPIDPVRIVSIADMDLSYALAGTLVQWDKDKQPSAGVAGSWEPTASNVYTFKIRKNLKWSDGSPVTALQIKESFERGFKQYPDDLRSLIALTKAITPKSEDTLEFHLIKNTAESNLLGKLTEPNFGVLKIKPDGKIDLSVTTGAFYLLKDTSDEIVLKKNPYWFHASEKMADEIIIRKPSAPIDLQTTLIENEWPNMVETNSLISKELMEKYKAKNFELWSRPIDKIFLFHPSKSFAKSEGPEVLRFFRKNLSRETLVKGLSGITLTNQVFPVGYQLHDAEMPANFADVKLPTKYTKEPIRILLSSTRVNKTLQENIRLMVKDATGVEPQFIQTTLDKLGEHKKKSDFDLYVGTYGLADPDPEGVMSYYFEGVAPTIESGKEPFVEKLDLARKEQDLSKRLKMMRSLMTEATTKGHVLPLFHLSTVGIGRPELDFSEVPTSDESVTLSKIRFKK